MAHVPGSSFAPRISNLAERRLHAFGPAGDWPALEPFIAGTVNAKAITAHWDDVARGLRHRPARAGSAPR